MNRTLGLRVFGVALSLLSAGCGSASGPSTAGGPPSASQAVSSAPVSASTGPSASLGVVERPIPRFEWQRLPAIGDGWLNDVAAWRGGLATVGQGIWLSRDASTWTKVRVPVVTRRNAAGDINAVAAWRDGLVAVGWQTRKVAGTEDWVTDATFWSSPDGTDWTVATGPEFELGYEGPDSLPYGLRDVAVFDDRLFAVGVGNTGMVWTSEDGTNWRKTAELAGEGGRRIAAGGASSLAVGGPGLVASGEDGCCGEYKAMLWTSADGEAWTYEPNLVGQGLNAVAATSTGLVAVAAGPGAWTSTNGHAWDWAEDQAAFDKGFMQDVTSDASGVVAAGLVRCAEPTAADPFAEDQCAAFWTSGDGLTWERFDSVPGPAGEVSGVTHFDDLVIAVGSNGKAHAEGSLATVWIGNPVVPAP